jgi:hypothetical protein
MPFHERPIEQLLEEYKLAIKWVESLIQDIKKLPRIYKYLEVIETTVRANKEDKPNPNEILLVLEAHQKSDLLIQIHNKFHNRKEIPFVNKLRDSMFGPVFLHKEVLQGKGPSQNSFGRDTESEFYFATHIKNPEIVSFQGNDVVYDLGDYKLGVEVKRIHSLDQIESNFRKACDQIQDNRAVKYGMVGFRFDNHYLKEDPFGLKLIDRDQNILNYATSDDCFRYAETQTKFFIDKVGNKMLNASNAYQKVVGVGVFGLFPGKIKITETPFLVGHFSFGWFGGMPKPSKKVFIKMTSEFEDP